MNWGGANSDWRAVGGSLLVVRQEVLGKADYHGRLGKDLLQQAEEHTGRCNFLESPMTTDLVKMCMRDEKKGWYSQGLADQRPVLVVLGHPAQVWHSC